MCACIGNDFILMDIFLLFSFFLRWQRDGMEEEWIVELLVGECFKAVDSTIRTLFIQSIRICLLSLHDVDEFQWRLVDGMYEWQQVIRFLRWSATWYLCGYRNFKRFLPMRDDGHSAHFAYNSTSCWRILMNFLTGAGRLTDKHYNITVVGKCQH